MRDGDTEYLLGSRETMNTPPPKKKILNQICINLKNDPNGSKKTHGKIPCLVAYMQLHHLQIMTRHFGLERKRSHVWLMPLASQYLLLVLYNVQA